MIKNLSVNAGDTKHADLIPGWGRSPGEGNGNPLQYSCLENSRQELDATEHICVHKHTHIMHESIHIKILLWCYKFIIKKRTKGRAKCEPLRTVEMF